MNGSDQPSRPIGVIFLSILRHCICVSVLQKVTKLDSSNLKDYSGPVGTFRFSLLSSLSVHLICAVPENAVTDRQTYETQVL